MPMWTIWLIILICLVFIEVITVNLVSIWFIASALVSLFLSFIIDSFYLEFAIFVLLGLILLLLTRPLVLTKLSPKKVKTNLDRVVGMKGEVTEDVSFNHIGEVYVDNKRWSAIAPYDLKKGTKVVVEAIEGVKLQIRKEEE